MSDTGPKPTGASGIRSGLQPGGTTPASRSGAIEGAIGTGGGSTANHPTGNARDDEPAPADQDKTSRR
jgi:hypothetical protein